jgi:ankyrin repeat protein
MGNTGSVVQGLYGSSGLGGYHMQ